MKTIRRYFATQEEAIQAAKKRASSRYRTQYVYRANPDPHSETAFYLRELVDKTQKPVLKVRYDGSVHQLQETPTMNPEFVTEIVALARQIAGYVGYTDLDNGLQPLATLLLKVGREIKELYDAYTVHTPEADVYAEAADCLYYAACCWQHGDGTAYGTVVEVFSNLDLDMAKAMAAALAKYRYRASGPNVKNVEIERTLIEAALEKLP